MTYHIIAFLISLAVQVYQKAAPHVKRAAVAITPPVIVDMLKPLPIVNPNPNDVQSILVREANNPNFRSLDDPRYGKGVFGYM